MTGSWGVKMTRSCLNVPAARISSSCPRKIFPMVSSCSIRAGRGDRCTAVPVTIPWRNGRTHKAPIAKVSGTILWVHTLLFFANFRAWNTKFVDWEANIERLQMSETSEPHRTIPSGMPVHWRWPQFYCGTRYYCACATLRHSCLTTVTCALSSFAADSVAGCDSAELDMYSDSCVFTSLLSHHTPIAHEESATRNNLYFVMWHDMIVTRDVITLIAVLASQTLRI